MSSLLFFERAKFGVLSVETAAARKEVPTSSLEEAWASLEVSKISPEESLVEVKAAFEELYSNYFSKEGTPAQGNRVYAWDSWNLLLGFDEILQQMKDRANREVEALRNREEKSVKIMACWQDDNKVLSHKIASLEAKLLKASSQEDLYHCMSWGPEMTPTYWHHVLLPMMLVSIGAQMCCLQLPVVFQLTPSSKDKCVPPLVGTIVALFALQHHNYLRL
ncbi:hypothetical protein DSO57_1015563 [Entomophthora muscae]|uniref:Uncharacterized protein n=1 Tax=Entomophthora muscae TaxID=34485 RepID=A0ACC2RWK5_9FUNG|nr:hypothetical protein DSO57_1015563 [Entomophthora muscae]